MSDSPAGSKLEELLRRLEQGARSVFGGSILSPRFAVGDFRFGISWETSCVPQLPLFATVVSFAGLWLKNNIMALTRALSGSIITKKSKGGTDNES